MTTTTYSSVADSTTDAGFRAWGSELSGALATVGLVQTSDTGQINWATVVRAAVSTAAGYEIWRFVDSSLYLKVEYGQGTSIANAQCWITVGLGSNGAGALTGQLSTRNTFLTGIPAVSIVTNYTSYICRTADSVSIVWKMNGSNSAYPMGLLVVGKTVDAAGVATSTGFAVLRCATSTGAPQLQSVRLASVSATNNDTTNFCVIPGNPSSSQTGANVQAYLCWMNVHEVMPFSWTCAYLQSEQLKTTPFAVTLIASVTHTYLPLGQMGTGGTINGQSATAYSLAVIYE